MLDEMASLGGHPVSTSDEGWTRFGEAVATQMEEDQHLFMLAERPASPLTAIGLAQASVTAREFVFEPTRVLHIHALYVEPATRREGIGRALLRATLEWGRSQGCEEAVLNVLVGNPARGLYEDLGFRPFQTKMLHRL
jgi:GNAT superfamily N-acetyltransferase